MTKFTVTTSATFTRKGVRCEITRQTHGQGRVNKIVNGVTYTHVQLYPLCPARFEWIREDNLINKTIAT